MRNLSSRKPLSDVSTDDLKKQGQLLQAISYVAAFFIVANIGYALFRLVSHKVDSVSELAGGTFVSMGGFGASLLFGSYTLKKIKAELTIREANK